MMNHLPILFLLLFHFKFSNFYSLNLSIGMAIYYFFMSILLILNLQLFQQISSHFSIANLAPKLYNYFCLVQLFCPQNFLLQPLLQDFIHFQFWFFLQMFVHLYKVKTLFYPSISIKDFPLNRLHSNGSLYFIFKQLKINFQHSFLFLIISNQKFINYDSVQK